MSNSANKPHLVPIPAPADPEAMRSDLSQPFPIEIGGRWYVCSDELEQEQRA